MPEWKDMTILLSSKPFGETGMLVSVLSKNNGRYKSFVHGGNSVKKRSIFQKGNICNAEWKARISDQMGSIKLELVSSTATNFFTFLFNLLLYQQFVRFLTIFSQKGNPTRIFLLQL